MRHILFTLLVFTLTLFSNITYLSAQDTPSIENIGSVEIDDLSDEQIQSFIDKSESSGYSEDQLIVMAKSRGMSEIQIQKLRDRIEELQEDNEGEDLLDQLVREREFDQQELAFDPFGQISEDSLSYIDGLKIFGSDFFETSTLNFETGINMPTPSNYVIGAGDEIIIDIWGASEQSYQLLVSPEGSIRIPSLGPIYLSGLNIDKARSKVISRLKKIYSTIGSSSNADLSLGQTRSINVHIIGDAKKPGTYQLSSFSTVFNALYSAGGPSESGSYRKVEVFREKELISTFDVYAFLVDGTGDNITLQDQDLIIVKPYQSRIRFEGEVKNPAVYELLTGESYNDLLLFSGGYTEKAYRGVVNLRRFEGNHKTLKSISLDQEDFEMMNGDAISVLKISNKFENRVTIEGPVYHPGEYELVSGMTLSQLLEKADGLMGEAFMDRGIIIRQEEDLSLNNIEFDLKLIIAGKTNVILQNNDLIKLQSIYDLRDQFKLDIQGEVHKPGTYAYIENMTVENLIYIAGGFKESAAKSFVEVARRIQDDASGNEDGKMAEIFNLSINELLKIEEGDSEFKLQPYDVVVVRKSPFSVEQEVVEIEGEVKFPGRYVLKDKEERISDVLERAGGVNKFAYSEGAILVRRTEYYIGENRDLMDGDDDDENLDDLLEDAVKIRKQDLTDVFTKDDTLALKNSSFFKSKEAIGVDINQILKNKGAGADLILQKGDVLKIPREPQTVRVRGNVLYPGNIRYEKKLKLRKYIDAAGGFDQLAKKNNTYIVYANNTAAQTSKFLFFRRYPKIKPGAEIIVPLKNEKQQISPQSWVAMASTLTSMIYVITLINQ